MAALPETDYVHVLVEAAKLAFADRDRHLTDPGFMRVSPEELLAPERLERLAGRISRRRAMSPGDAAARAGDTIAITTADRGRQCRVAHPVALLHLGLRRSWRATPASSCRIAAASSRSIPASANALAPRKLHDAHARTLDVPREWSRALRLRHDGRARVSPRRRPRCVTRRLHRGLGPQAAVEAPRWLYGRTWGAPSRALNLEGRYPARPRARPGRTGSRRARSARPGRPVRPRPVCLALAGGRRGLLGGSDPRADGAALGF